MRASPPGAPSGGRPRSALLFRYVLILTAMNLVWEFAQMPLYTIGQAGTAGEIALAALHCTLGDATIGGLSMLVALLLVAPADWPRVGRAKALATAVLLGVGSAVFSEWLNVEARGSWAYSDLMPVLPPFGTGLSPVLQWLVVPPAAYLVTLWPMRLRQAKASTPGFPRR